MSRSPIYSSDADVFIGDEVLQVTHSADGVAELHRQLMELRHIVYQNGITIRRLDSTLWATQARVKFLENVLWRRVCRWLKKHKDNLMIRMRSL